MVRSLPLVAFALLSASLASAQPILRGEPGELGDAGLLECDGGDCTLNQTLVVDGDVFIDNGTLSADLIAGDAGEFADMVAGSLTVDDQITLPDCPDGYSRNFSGICEREVASGIYDEVVPIGDFWIDRFEVSVWEQPNCSGEQYGDPTDGDDFPDPGFPDNGNWEEPAYACSIEGEYPTGYMTWFQAQQACAAAGKSLCTNAQWQAAAAGTPDDTTCNIDHGAAEATGFNAGCESAWGVKDLVGNHWEWVAEWQGHPGWNGTENLFDGDPDGDGIQEYGNDGYWAGGPDLDSMVSRGTDGSWRPSSPAIEDNGHPTGSSYGPAAIRRGGAYNKGASAGIFATCLIYGPSGHASANGARCCIER